MQENNRILDWFKKRTDAVEQKATQPPSAEHLNREDAQVAALKPSRMVNIAIKQGQRLATGEEALKRGKGVEGVKQAFQEFEDFDSGF